MAKSLNNKRCLTNKIDSNKLENNNLVKKRKHLTVQSNTDSLVAPETLDSDWYPPNWTETFEAIRKMRKDFVAPVDNMGCDQAANSNESPEV